jgi:hypothetical protein
MKTVLTTTAISLLLGSAAMGLAIHTANAGNWIDGTVTESNLRDEFTAGGEVFKVVLSTGGTPRGGQTIVAPPVGSVVSVFSWFNDLEGPYTAMHVIIHQVPSE